MEWSLFKSRPQNIKDIIQIPLVLFNQSFLDTCHKCVIKSRYSTERSIPSLDVGAGSEGLVRDVKDFDRLTTKANQKFRFVFLAPFQTRKNYNFFFRFKKIRYNSGIRITNI